MPSFGRCCAPDALVLLLLIVAQKKMIESGTCRLGRLLVQARRLIVRQPHSCFRDLNAAQHPDAGALFALPGGVCVAVADMRREWQSQERTQCYMTASSELVREDRSNYHADRVLSGLQAGVSPRVQQHPPHSLDRRQQPPEAPGPDVGMPPSFDWRPEEADGKLGMEGTTKMPHWASGPPTWPHKEENSRLKLKGFIGQRTRSILFSHKVQPVVAAVHEIQSVMTPWQVSMALSRLARLMPSEPHQRHRPKTVAALDILCSKLERAAADFDSQGLANSVHAMAGLNLHKPSVLVGVGRHITTRAPSFTPQNLANTVRAFSKFLRSSAAALSFVLCLHPRPRLHAPPCTLPLLVHGE